MSGHYPTRFRKYKRQISQRERNLWGGPSPIIRRASKRKGQQCGTSGATQETNIIPDLEPVECDESLHGGVLNVGKEVKGLGMLTFIHTILFAAGLAGHLVGMTGD